MLCQITYQTPLLFSLISKMITPYVHSYYNGHFVYLN